MGQAPAAPFEDALRRARGVRPRTRRRGTVREDTARLSAPRNLQNDLGIVVPDEVTARLRSVADLQDAVTRLTATAPTPATRPKDPS